MTVSKIILALLPAVAAYAQILSWEEYRTMAPAGVHVLRLQSGDGQLLYFGARHTRDASDPQAEEIARLWREFRPTVALTEGGVPPVAGSAAEAVLRYGEAGLVRFLAKRDRVPVKSLDPSHAEQVAALLQSFPPDRVKLFFFLRAIADLRKDSRRRDSLSQFAEAELTRLSGTPGLHAAPRSLRDVDAAVPNWREVPESWFNPLRSESFTNEVNRELSQYRNRQMVKLLTVQVAEGQRVFAVVGRTHLEMQERALRLTLK